LKQVVNDALRRALGPGADVVPRRRPERVDRRRTSQGHGDIVLGRRADLEVGQGGVVHHVPARPHDRRAGAGQHGHGRGDDKGTAKRPSHGREVWTGRGVAVNGRRP